MGLGCRLDMVEGEKGVAAAHHRDVENVVDVNVPPVPRCSKRGG